MDENLKKHPKVSILVPIYGTEKYIEKCARSLFEQTYDNIEYIFVNDCTKDASVEILKKTIEDYPQRKSQVTIISHNTNRGLAASRLTAFEHSTGAYLWCVDSDDYADVQAVSIIVPYMERGYDFISFNYSFTISSARTSCFLNFRLFFYLCSTRTSTLFLPK